MFFVEVAEVITTCFGALQLSQRHYFYQSVRFRWQLKNMALKKRLSFFNLFKIFQLYDLHNFSTTRPSSYRARIIFSLKCTKPCGFARGRTSRLSSSSPSSATLKLKLSERAGSISKEPDGKVIISSTSYWDAEQQKTDGSLVQRFKNLETRRLTSHCKQISEVSLYLRY